jgi:putative spermidine/putrescine transport system ATP-binding protein
VALARAIVFQPKILLMDEPLSALDKKLREEMQIELRQLHDSLNMTTVYVTHDQKEALTMSDRVAVINEGGLMQLDTPSAIYKKPNNAFIADFIGESSLLSVKVSKKNVYLGNTKIFVEHSVEEDGEFLLVVRPEKLFLMQDNPTDCNTFSGIIVESIYQGESQLLIIKLDPESYGDQMLRMRVPNGTASLQELPSIGSKVTVGLKKFDSFLVE